MLDRGKVINALQDKERKFQEFVAERDKQRFALEEQLAQFLRYDYQAIINMLAERGLAWPGALPTQELDAAQALCIPFASTWQNHQEARAWALQTLRNRTVAAVDGSQITPTGEYSVPIGAMQIGWFVNEHREGGSYEKDVYFEVMAPQEVVDDESTNMESGQPDRRVNLLRFVSECQKLCELMVRSEHLPMLEKPLCFFDGSFIISFAGQMRPNLATPYIGAIIQLLDCSKRTRVPLVGFVDDSHSRDLVTLMGHITQRHDGRATGDAAMLHGHLPATWGVRTPFFACAREDGLSKEERAPFYTETVFTYMRLTSERPPARIEMPIWILEDGRAEEIMDLVRAECVVGAGYPYAIETADALAVISQQDRQRFYALFEQFAQRQEIDFTRTRKAASKRVRR